MKMPRIRKVVIPAAGVGTRSLPATKVVPKEMLPVSGKPLIQFAVEEAVASGIETVILVISSGKSLVTEHFQRNAGLEKLLLQRGQVEELEQIIALSAQAEVVTVWQEAPRGVADAIRCARSVVGDEVFGVILPDALIASARPCIRQLMDCYQKYPGCVIATREVSRSEVRRFGMLDVTPLSSPDSLSRVFRVNSLVERPEPDSAPSRYGIFGRYIFEPEIFECIDATVAGFGGELQVTDSLALFSRRSPVYACCFEGTHYDAGDRFGFLQANIEYSLKDPVISCQLKHYLATLDLKSLLPAS
jgi:UTP--glucose-1-phosphate uridylyltransferase